jgi:transcriptional regulator with XRE-family HTH domain
MSELLNSLRAEFIRTKDDKEYRHAYADEALNATIATQIKVLREQRDLTQEALAREAQMKQSMISRYENVNYSSWSIKTLKKLAEAFDVFLEVRFRSFRNLVESAETLSGEALQVAAFTDDPFFKQVQPAAADVQSRVAGAAGVPLGVSATVNMPIRESAMRAAGGKLPHGGYAGRPTRFANPEIQCNS